MNGQLSILGRWCEDRVTGFSGRATGIVHYLSGCVQVCISPKVGTDGKLPDGHFFDIQRLKVVEEVVPIMLDNVATPGFDKLPATR